jgi:hypothetical protein
MRDRTVVVMWVLGLPSGSWLVPSAFLGSSILRGSGPAAVPCQRLSQVAAPAGGGPASVLGVTLAPGLGAVGSV